MAFYSVEKVIAMVDDRDNSDDDDDLINLEE